jgi:ribosome-associated toxin RatA of RatAB toxin-antitoxin module
MSLGGEGNIEVAATPEDCYALVVELDRYPEWQSQVRTAEVFERDAEGRPVVVETLSDARVRDVRYRLRYRHEPPHRMSWTYIEGDVKDVTGHYLFEDLGNGLTRATYALEVDPGMRLGLLLRGPVAGKVREYILSTTLEELKATVEARAAGS